MRPRVILNPAAGGGRVRRRRDEIVRLLAGALGQCEVAESAAPGDATRLAAGAVRDGCPLVVAVGGDGTLNEVVDGLLSSAVAACGPELGVVMVGTGADFARALDLPAAIPEQVARLAAGRARPIDAGRVHFAADDGTARRRHFVNVAGFGLTGAVDRLVNSSAWVRALGSRAAYHLALARALPSWRNATVSLSVDGGPEFVVASLLCAVANGGWFGGGLRVAPGASLHDGAFDIVIVDDIGKGTLLRRFPTVYRGAHVTLPQVSVVRGAVLEARASAGEFVPLDVDGESPGRLPARFEILPGALRIRA